MAKQEPAYRRVLAELRSRILSGDLTPGSKLPSVREIAEQYGVGNTTAARVISELRAEGRVTSHQGSGAYVREFREIRRSSPSRLARERWTRGLAIQAADTEDRPHAVDVTVGEQPAPDFVAAALDTRPGDPVVFRARRFVIDGRPVQLATSYLPTDLARGTPIMFTNPGEGGIYKRLAESGHEPVAFVEELRCRMPHPDESEALELPEGTPVIEIVRHAFQADHRCVEINHMILDATAYVLDYTFSTDSLTISPPATDS